MIYARRLKSGRWRLYEVADRALVQWRGANAESRVVHDPWGFIPSFDTIEAAKSYAKNSRLGYDGEWPKCNLCGHYYRLTEDAHLNPRHCEEQAAVEARRKR